MDGWIQIHGSLASRPAVPFKKKGRAGSIQPARRAAGLQGLQASRFRLQGCLRYNFDLCICDLSLLHTQLWKLRIVKITGNSEK